MKRLLLFFFLAIATNSLLYSQTKEWNLVRQGNEYLANKRYAEAEHCYLKARALNKNNLLISYNLGLTYIAKKDYKAARLFFETVVKQTEDKLLKSKSLYNLGYMAQREASNTQNDNPQAAYKHAISYYKSALRCNPNDSDAKYNLSLCMKRVQQLKQKSHERASSTSTKPKDNNSSSSNNATATQLLNMARQADAQTKQKVNQSVSRRKKMEKNW